MRAACAIACASLLAGCAAAPGALADRPQAAAPAAIPAGATHATVWIFVSTDCPICNGYQPELEAMRGRWQPRGVEFVGVYAELPVTAEEVADHVRRFGIRFPVRIDADRSLRRRFGVRVVPEVVVTAGGPGSATEPAAFLYRGRIDDRWPERGTRRPSATVHDLEDALSAIAGGRAPDVRETTAVGCVLEP
jgi:hypothetical protein